jgi:hypothetical protein
VIYTCCEDRRRELVREDARLNGIDELEVLDQEAPTGSPRQQTLLVRCLKPLRALTAENVRIEGGTRIRPVRVLWATRGDRLPATLPISAAERAYFAGLPERRNLLLVRTDSPGDFSTYRLRLVRGQGQDEPPPTFDGPLSAVDFSFKVECPSDFDCRHQPRCHLDRPDEPPIDYLARDYASLRRMLLDRLSLIAPAWTERNPADLGVALVELLAYVGDQLSYRQDAIATEAYLGTARRRTSVRRHARLVDYAMHDGRNARAWVQVRADADLRAAGPGQPVLPAGTPLLTRVEGLPGRLPPDSDLHRRALEAAPEAFETMHDLQDVIAAHDEIRFHTWGAESCCLPTGATRATLQGRLPELRAGAVLIFEEVLGPRTGQADDADPSHRHAVRLTEVRPASDPLGPRLGLTDDAVTEIAWAEADALRFPLCISARTDEDGRLVNDVSVARGNVVLVDHGRRVEEPLPGEVERWTVPAETIRQLPEPGADRCAPRAAERLPARFGPRLRFGPLSQVGQIRVRRDGQILALPFDPLGPAAEALEPPLHGVLPSIALVASGQSWHPRPDLLAAHRFDRAFVAETEDDGRARLRFGDGGHGRRPASGTVFQARYRVGNGARGNVGAEAIGHVVLADDGITGVRNPLPARGGIEPETIESVRQAAPWAFRTQERAVTAADYAEVAERRGDLQRAAATFRWTGSWSTVFVTADRRGGAPVDEGFSAGLREHLERYRMAGYDLEVDAPRPVSLELAMAVCVEPGYLRSEVQTVLLDVFSNRVRPDGSLGLFHPDRFTFGQTVYLSPFYAAAMGVEGVASVLVTAFGRQGNPDPRALRDGRLELGRTEIARLDNDPSFPEHGVLRLQMEGGR